MAIWQFKMEVIPDSVVAGRAELADHECYEATWWQSEQPAAEFITALSSLLPAKTSWSEDLLQWGQQGSDLIEVWYEAGQVDGVSLRIDARELNLALIDKLVDAMNTWQCALLDIRSRVVMPKTTRELIRVIWQSPSHQVVMNPEKWLPEMAKAAEQQYKQDE